MLETELAGAPLLGGRRIVDAPVPILTDTPGHVMHYKDLLRRVEAQTCMRVRGGDPAATMLADWTATPGPRLGRSLRALPPGPQPRLVA